MGAPGTQRFSGDSEDMLFSPIRCSSLAMLTGDIPGKEDKRLALVITEFIRERGRETWSLDLDRKGQGRPVWQRSTIPHPHVPSPSVGESVKLVRQVCEKR